MLLIFAKDVVILSRKIFEVWWPKNLNKNNQSIWSQHDLHCCSKTEYLDSIENFEKS